MSGYAGEAGRLCVLTVSGSPGEATLEVKANDNKTTSSKWIGAVDQFGMCAEMQRACYKCPGFLPLGKETLQQAKSKPHCEIYPEYKLQQGEPMGRCKQCNFTICGVARSEGFQFQVPAPGAKEFPFTPLRGDTPQMAAHVKFGVWNIEKVIGDGGSGGIAGLTDLFESFGLEMEKMPNAIAFCKQQEVNNVQEVVQFGGAEDFVIALNLPKIKQNKLLKHMQDTYK